MRIPNSGLYIDNPAYPVLQAIVSYWGVTSAAGNAGGTTLVCADLATQPNYDGLSIKILSGTYAGQVRTIYTHVTNTLTFGAAFGGQIAAGTLFVILSALGSGGGPGPSPVEGLSYYGVVDAVPGANQFTVGGLAGLGAGKFAGATNPYLVFVLRDAGGASAAPQGEQQAVTAYVTATGTFTTAAFTAAIAVGDEVLILNPNTAAGLIILAGLAVPAQDAITNVLMRDVTGNKTDTADYTPTATQSSIMRLLKGVLSSRVIAEGTITTSSATVPVDNTRAEGADYFNGCYLMPLTGACAFQPRLIIDFAAGGTFTINGFNPFTAATGLVAYVIIAAQTDNDLLLSIRGGGESLESLDDELDAILDLARSPQSGTLLMTGAEQQLYLETATVPFEFHGGYIDWTGLNAGAGEDTTIRVYVRLVPGGALRLIYAETFLAAAVPNPPAVPFPRDVNTQVVPGRLFNVYGVQVTAEQAAVGAGWNTLTYEIFDAKRGT